jgi:hypothetical protein
MGTRNAGSDNDSYFDDMFVRLDLGSEGCEQYTAVGISESIYNRGVKLYPNPISELATVEVLRPNSNSNYTLSIFDRAGKAVQSLTSASGKFTFNVDGLAAGMYFYQLSDGDWHSTGKLVVD